MLILMAMMVRDREVGRGIGVLQCIIPSSVYYCGICFHGWALHSLLAVPVGYLAFSTNDKVI